MQRWMDGPRDVMPRCAIPNAYLLFSADTSKGWRVINFRVSFDKGQREVDRGRWRVLRDPVTCELIGFQVISRAAARVDQDVRSMGNQVAGITSTEMRVFAGLRGASHTSRLSEDERASLRQPEDFIERTVHKVIVWPYVGPAPGDVLRVWPRSK